MIDFVGQSAAAPAPPCLFVYGDSTLFKRADHIELGWEIVQPILDAWQALPPREFPNYAAGTWGPSAAVELLRRDRRGWHSCAARA